MARVGAIDGLWSVAAACVLLAGCGGEEGQAEATDGSSSASFLRVEPPAASGAEELDASATQPEELVPERAALDGASAGEAAPPEAGRRAAGRRAAGDVSSEPATASVGAEDGGVAGPFVEVERALEAGDFALAASGAGRGLLAGMRSDPPAPRESLQRWTELLRRAQAGRRWSRRGAWPSIETTVAPGDSLIAIRARVLKANPGLLLCTGLIARANELASETAIRPGDVLRIPTDRASVRADISARWVVYLLGAEPVAAWEVGVGKPESPTRPGSYTIGLKQENPMWTPEGRAPVPFGDPANPLGTRWMAWYDAGRNTSLGFHGTNAAQGMGQAVSDGCIRMRNQDVEELFAILPRDATVVIEP